MVQGIIIDKELCELCETCVDTCPFGCITITDYPVIGADCRFCGSCVEACPVGAINITKKEEKENLSQYQGILVFAEQRDGLIADVSLEILGKGKELATRLDQSLSAVLLGDDIETASKNLIAYGADVVYVYDDPIYCEFQVEPYTDALVELLKEEKQNILLIGATSIGRSLAPRVAVRLKTGLTADCTHLDVDVEKGLLIQTRPAFGGNIMATILCPNCRPQMATVRPKVMNKMEPDLKRRGSIIKKSRPVNGTCRTKVFEIVRNKDGLGVSLADIIVAGGKGLGNPEGFKLLERLAKALEGSVGASRPCIDEGWIDFSHQIGLSGKTVKPHVYVACGISGAAQHVAGMETSDIVIAINTDSKAPIFNIADYGIVGDLYEIVPELINIFSGTNLEKNEAEMGR
ncbi:MAG: FAD-binding protein [Candidatus Hodarchaeota archaeon]